MREIKKIIIHCSDTPDDIHYDIEHIRDWHVNGNKWTDVGYHYVVTRMGDVQEGRRVERTGAHTKGHNHDSIGVCWVGRHKTSPRQYRALKELCATLLKKYKLDIYALFGHNNFTSEKTCPNISVEKLRLDVEPWLEKLKKKK